MTFTRLLSLGACLLALVVGTYRNTHHVTVTGKHGFLIKQMNTEQPGAGQTNTQNAWQTPDRNWTPQSPSNDIRDRFEPSHSDRQGRHLPGA